ERDQRGPEPAPPEAAPSIQHPAPPEAAPSIQHFGTIVPDSDRTVLEVLLDPARDGEFVTDREAQAAVLESRLPPGVHDRAVADSPGTRERAPVDVAALETAEPAEILQRKFGSHREAEPTVLEAQFGVFAEDETLHPVGPGSGTEIERATFEGL